MNECLLEELNALKEIYVDLKFQINDLSNELKIYFDAEVNINELNNVVIKNDSDSFNITYFPTLSLQFIFNDSCKLPAISLQTNWLSEELIKKLIEKMNSIIIDGFDSTLWNCFQFIENEILIYLFGNPKENELIINIESLTNNRKSNKELYSIMNDYNKRKSKIAFNNSIFECPSCMISKRGSQCLKIQNCQDIFCFNCASNFYNVQMKTGFLNFTCLVCNGDVQNEEVRCVLAKDEFERWDKLLFNQYLKQECITRNCPRCETITLIDDDISFNDIGICSQCGFTFCLQCNKTYHGSGNCENVNRYLREEEERINKIELSKIVTKCPSCKEAYEKSGGCNKMTCRICGKFFCHMCNKILNSSSPYDHFGLAPKCFL